jgi:hypothetical protein
MPLIFRVLGYGGNGLLCLFGLIALLSSDAPLFSLFMIGLGGVNLHIIRKIDIYSREEVWLEAELRKREMRRRIAELDRGSGAGGTAAEPKRISANDRASPPD